MRRSQKYAIREKIPTLKLDHTSLEIMEKLNPNALTGLPRNGFPGKKKDHLAAILLQRNPMSRIGSPPPSISGASVVSRNPVLSEQITKSVYHS